MALAGDNIVSIHVVDDAEESSADHDKTVFSNGRHEQIEQKKKETILDAGKRRKFNCFFFFVCFVLDPMCAAGLRLYVLEFQKHKQTKTFENRMGANCFVF